MNWKSILALILTVLMMLSLCACEEGGTAMPDDSEPAASELCDPEELEYCGKYIPVQVKIMGIAMGGDYVAGLEVELMAGGKGRITAEEETGSFT